MDSAVTTVTVQIGSEVSAQVLPNASNTVHIATSTPDVSFWSEIVNLLSTILNAIVN